MIRGIHHVAIHCQDIDRMKRFYKDAFGFEQVGDELGWERGTTLIDQVIDVPGSVARTVMLRAGTCYLELFQFAEPEPVNTRPLRPFDKGYTHFCADVTDIENEFVRLRAAGMKFKYDSPFDAGHVKTIYGQDPEGNIIEIQETVGGCEFPLENLPDVTAAH